MRVLLHLFFISRCGGPTTIGVLQWATNAATSLPLQIELETAASASATTSKGALWVGSTDTRPSTLALGANGQALTLVPLVRIELSWTHALAQRRTRWPNLEFHHSNHRMIHSIYHVEAIQFILPHYLQKQFGYSLDR